MFTIEISRAEQVNADTYALGEVLAYWISDNRQESVYLGRGADEAAALKHAKETIVDIDFDVSGGEIEYGVIVADAE